MATKNPFDLLGDDDAEDPSLLIAAQQVTIAAAKKAAPPKQPAQSQPAKLPSKPLPPAQAVKETRSESGRGGGRGGGRGYGRGRSGFKRDEGSFGNTGASAGLVAPEEGDGGKPSERRGGYSGSRGGYRGERRGGFSNGETDDGERPRRPFERRSGTGRGNELKREGSGRGNWGTPTDEIAPVTDEVVNETEKNVSDEKPVGEEAAANKENPENEPEEKEPEDKEMTLEEYEKLLEEKRKALQALKAEERKVDTKQFETMQPLANKKKGDDDVFIKLGSDKDKRKEASEKDEKSKKSVSINEFLKPAEGEKHYNTGGRGRGRGRGSRAGYGGKDGVSNVPAPPIEDPSHFPTLGGK